MKHRLVATLGPKSSTRRVTRKAILDVNLKKACETIIEPEAPMALRLLSNLLYGVTRVYTQKWDYLLSDTQAIQSSMRTFFKASQNNQIDRNAGKSKPEQLILADDPAFLVDGPIEPPPLDLEEMICLKSPYSSQAKFSPSFFQLSNSEKSAYNDPALGLETLSSSQALPSPHGINDYDPIRGSTIARKAGFDRIDDDELTLIQNDDLFEIDDHGEIHELPPNRQEQSPVGSFEQDSRSKYVSMTNGQDFMERPEEEISFEAVGSVAQGYTHPVQTFPLEAVSLIHSRDGLEPEVSARAPQKHRRKTAKKNLAAADRSTELGTMEISKMMSDYPQNMMSQNLFKSRMRAQAQSRKNAIHYVFGTGINFIGESIASSMPHNPLTEFHGAALMARITGKSLTAQLIGRKRQASREIRDFEPNKRIRSHEPQPGPEPGPEPFNMIFEDENPSILAEQNIQTNRSDKSVELGREVDSALKDSSAILPWNQSTSIFSHQKSSVRHPGSRFISASPLLGYGSAISGNNKVIDEMVTYEEGLNYIDDPATGTGDLIGNTGVIAQINENDDFELFGPAAAVDTQTASTSQWVHETLHKESENFLGFVQNAISIKAANGSDSIRAKSLTFLELFDPRKNSRIVAAQAFYHVLSLATKQHLWVDQISDRQDGNLKLEDDIYIGLF
ncbi:hypothetical protein K3495_g384 [Podosphaera aphanis]|nr:hypothetical protein K3495_g384 [Podosphaera aphanis]